MGGFSITTIAHIWVVFITFLHHCQGFERRTKYGCEGTTLHISCEEGTVINLVRANYGRFSISICNEEGITDWSVNCMEPRTLRVINARCDGKPSCRIPVDSNIFGDPCPGTNKYVEVHYTCEPIQTPATTAKSLPPWLIPPRATTEVATPSTTSTTTTSTTTTTTPTTTTSTTTSTTQRTVPNPLHRVTSTSSRPSTTIYDTTDLETIEKFVDHCPPKNSRGLFWNWTKMGEDAIQVCPQGSSGFARWSCGLDGMWSSERPNLGECQSLWLSRLEQRLQGATSSLNNVASDLSTSTETKTLFGGDFNIVAKLMQALAHRLRQELYVMPSQSEKENLVAELLQSVLKTASNLLDSSQQIGWDDLNLRKRSTAVTAIMIAVEENALLLAETINNEKNLAEATNNILSSVRIMRARGVFDQIFPQVETLRNEDSSVLVPSSALLETSVNGAVRLVFFLYDSLGPILSSHELYVNSKVMGVIASKGRYEKVQGRPVSFSMRHLISSDAKTQENLCATWDYVNKQWSTAECQVLNSNSTQTSCQCKRMGNYAILTRDITNDSPVNGITGEQISDVTENGTKVTQDDNLVIIVSVTCVAICLFFFLLGYLVYKHTDLKPRLDKFIQSKKPCFRCKKSESQTSSGSGLYPALTSSPTSTTVSAGTPTTMNASSNYLVQILEQQAETMKHVKNKAMPQQPRCNNGQSVYQVTAPRQQGPNSNGSNNQNVFRPVSPYGHHIYMEIDPVYQQQLMNQQHLLNQQAAQQQQNHQHMESSEGGHSDIQLSDISDDDLRRFSDGRARYAEERPLIRNTTANNHNHVNAENFTRQFMTTQRSQLQNGVTLRPVQVSTLNPGCNVHHSLRYGTSHRLMTTRGGQVPAATVNMFHHDPSGQLDAPITIALQGGDQFVSLQIDKPENTTSMYAPVHQ